MTAEMLPAFICSPLCSMRSWSCWTKADVHRLNDQRRIQEGVQRRCPVEDEEQLQAASFSGCRLCH